MILFQLSISIRWNPIPTVSGVSQPKCDFNLRIRRLSVNWIANLNVFHRLSSLWANASALYRVCIEWTDMCLTWTLAQTPLLVRGRRCPQLSLCLNRFDQMKFQTKMYLSTSFFAIMRLTLDCFFRDEGIRTLFYPGAPNASWELWLVPNKYTTDHSGSEAKDRFLVMSTNWI